MDQPSDFCTDCGNLIEIPQFGDSIECNNCKGKFSLADYPIKPIVSEIEFKEKKLWLEQAKQIKEFGKIQEEEQQNQKALIKQECPQCQNQEMYFWTVQLRSVDEGSTVFYNCPKCNHTFTQNN
ncbi:hypothetical protein PPERSA_10440 [Pseudocohnilembus persalinus]|uniref:DNA-directed RNA polymerase subunit n=1 Tax=Pseudocohnilembus persalinus TaxID=266149 RepID=A0A0V0R0N3_PSEPJ|nr:hypothetical protein PPERSA_10440 [Pseudocohnilembus persalinus]|eukprot:KRX08078.1 hypothetical protein PPERSA_10440 [Pseudocohnilembus persalinus]